MEGEEQSIDRLFMAAQQALFLANFLFDRNRLAEGRRYMGKIRQMGESLKKIASSPTVKKLTEELNEHRHVEVELVFR